MNSKLSFAIATVLGGAAIIPAATAAGADTASDSLGEIIVTAQRRSESMQNVPISMQAFTAQALADLNVATFDDYIKYLPNVSSANNGPGQNEVFMRGLSAGAQPSQGSGSTAVFPNVAIYLDNQSGQLPGRNLDIYAADLNRIEVLEGPQGTLFGSGAEAGMIRYITNEPKINKTEGSIKAGYGVTAHGDPNSDMTAVLNLPLIDDHLAVRGVFYNDHRGGYIDNVPATFTRKNTDIGIHYANFPAVNGACPDGMPNNGYCVPPGSPSINNYAIARRASNPAVYNGLRVSALYKFNDDWDLLVSQMYQNLRTDGVFYQQTNASDGQPLNPLEVTLFNPSYNKDQFESTAWTLNGKLGPIRMVYTGGYLVRKVEQVGDYTNYSRGVYADYYQCYGPGTGAYAHFPVNGGAGDTSLTPTCFSPSAVWRSVERNEHLQNELRFSTPDEWRLRAIAGAYVEDNKLWDQSDWRYKNVPPCTGGTPGVPGPGNSGCFTQVGTDPGATVVNPGVRDVNSSFYQDDVRDVKQTAFFVSMDFDIIPKVLTITGGTRWFQFKNSFRGSVGGSFYCFEQGAPGTTGCLADNYGLEGQHLKDTESGFKSRGNVTWHITPDMMVYYTYSQGFRPGGFNQNGGTNHAFGTDGNAQYILPSAYTSDKLTNNEVGFKGTFWNRRIQVNAAYYRENWDNVQVAFFNPGLVGNVFYDTNGQNFLLKGLEASIDAKVLPGLTLQAAGSWNHSEQTNSPALIDNNPASNNYGQPITVNCGGSFYSGTCNPVSNPFGPVGAPTANSPPLQFSLRARYDGSFGDYSWYAQIGAVHTGHSYTQAGANPTLAQTGAITTGRLRFEDPAYSTYDASVGVTRDAWTVSIFGENLGNSNAAVFTSTDQFIVAQTPLRPRVIGVNVGFKF
ncbi:MAG: TonB-dependent receptor [Proteobacteria bacterium]|nr:TonB-dependent receptor [Pseudomonadota bacterium]